MAYQIEMLWECSHCNVTGNKGLSKHCARCGYPKDDKCREYFPANITEHNALTGDKARRALAGPDWKCLYCGAFQSALNECCTECGADRKSGEQAWAHEVQAITDGQEAVVIREGRKLKVTDYGHAHGGYLVIDGGLEETHEDLAWRINQSRETQAASDSYRKAAPRQNVPVPRRRLPWKRLGLGLGIILLISSVLWILFRTRIVEGTVQEVSWKSLVHVERFQVWRKEGWDPPAQAFEIRNEGSRVHHYDYVVVGSHQEPYTETYSCGQTCVPVPPSCVSNGNGTATCSGGGQRCTPKMCNRTAYRTIIDHESVPRYQDWYSWNIWDWGFNRTVQHAGLGTDPTWPSEAELTVPLTPGQKERHRREPIYRVRLAGPSEDTYTYTPKSLEELQKYAKGQACRFKVGIIHGVEVLPN